MDFSSAYQNLYQSIFDLYHLPENKSKLLFHGWHHIQFVNKKSIEFASELNCNVEKVAAAALIHDLNYIFSEKLEPEEARKQQLDYLVKSGYSQAESNEIADLIESCHTEYRGSRELSLEAQALSDADTLFKMLPTTPILFASKFMSQTKYSIEKWTKKILDEQVPLLESGKIFYTESAKDKYHSWAKLNIEFIKLVSESLTDPDVKEMLATASELGVL